MRVVCPAEGWSAAASVWFIGTILMAQIQRTSSYGISAAGAARLPAGMRNVASVDNLAPLEELATRVGISFQDAAFLFQGYGGENATSGGGGGGRDREAGRQGLRVPGIVNAPSETFAAMIEQQDGTGMGAASLGNMLKRGVTTYLNRAIQTYETNAKVISRDGFVFRGGNVSVSY